MDAEKLHSAGYEVKRDAHGNIWGVYNATGTARTVYDPAWNSDACTESRRPWTASYDRSAPGAPQSSWRILFTGRGGVRRFGSPEAAIRAAEAAYKHHEHYQQQQQQQQQQPSEPDPRLVDALQAVAKLRHDHDDLQAEARGLRSQRAVLQAREAVLEYRLDQVVHNVAGRALTMASRLRGMIAASTVDGVPVEPFTNEQIIDFLEEVARDTFAAVVASPPRPDSTTVEFPQQMSFDLEARHE